MNGWSVAAVFYVAGFALCWFFDEQAWKRGEKKSREAPWLLVWPLVGLVLIWALTVRKRDTPTQGQRTMPILFHFSNADGSIEYVCVEDVTDPAEIDTDDLVIGDAECNGWEPISLDLSPGFTFKRQDL